MTRHMKMDRAQMAKLLRRLRFDQRNGQMESFDYTVNSTGDRTVAYRQGAGRRYYHVYA